MAELYDSQYKVTDGVTKANAAYFNPIWQSIDLRLNDLEVSGLTVPIIIPGALTTGRKAIIPVPWIPSSIQVALSSPVYPAGQVVKVQLYKNGEPGGGAAGTALFTSGGRPQLGLVGADPDGVSSWYTATEAIPLAATDKIAVDVEQADSGPLSGLLILVRLVP